MNRGQTVFAQLIQFISHNDFYRFVDRYNGDWRVRHLSCWEQFLAMAFAQLTRRESLRDIEVSLAAHRRQLYHAGFRSPVKRSTLADANETRDWRIYSDLAQHLIQQVRPLYKDVDLGLDLDGTLYALDSSIIDLSLTLFPWAPHERSRAAVKLNTLLDVQSAIPTMIDVTGAHSGDSQVLDRIIPEPGCFIVMDRGYVDFTRLYRLHQALAYFVVRAKHNLLFHRRQSHRIDRATGVRSDQTIVLSGRYTAPKFPALLRRVSFYAADIDQRFVFLTNNFQIPSPIVAAIYHQRWQIELFFKWIKQHLRIKRFFGTSPNAVKTQIWTAMATYALIAIAKKRFALQHSLYTILQILSTSLFEKTPVPLVFQRYDDEVSNTASSNQLNLFEI
ncbi:MAG: IS4 family transposase [Blastocatellia bacterium]|nr:IS4 family transposase [Blastocatellia bacterium]